MRLYFLHGGKRVWLSSWLETGGWPVMFIPLVIAYFHRRKIEGSTTKVIFITPRVFLAAAVIGILTGLDDYFYANGVAKLPVSTSSLIISTQLAFTALFAFLLVKQKFTPYSLNAVFLMTVGAAVLALHTSSDRPKGESKKAYFLGFFMTLAASALYGFLLPFIELTYAKAKQAITYTLVMEIQLVMCFFATAFCTVGMLVNHDFQAIAIEAKNCDMGEAKYYAVLIWSTISWQCFFLGAVGVIFCSSSLLSGIIIAVLFPVIEILGFLIYHESFKLEKVISLVLCVWGLVSYFYGEFRHTKKISAEEKEMDQITNIT